VIVHDVDNVAQNFVIAWLGTLPFRRGTTCRLRKVPRSIGTQGGSDSHTIYTPPTNTKKGAGGDGPQRPL